MSKVSPVPRAAQVAINRTRAGLLSAGRAQAAAATSMAGLRRPLPWGGGVTVQASTRMGSRQFCVFEEVVKLFRGDVV